LAPARPGREQQGKQNRLHKWSHLRVYAGLGRWCRTLIRVGCLPGSRCFRPRFLDFVAWVVVFIIPKPNTIRSSTESFSGKVRTVLISLHAGETGSLALPFGIEFRQPALDGDDFVLDHMGKGLMLRS
jgi:hypothetical protein